MNRYESGRHSRDGRGQGPNRFSSKQGSKRKPSRRRSAQNFPKAPDPRGERLQKVLAAAGIGSRRDCEELITAGRVEVDKEIVTVLGTRVHADTQEIRVDGTPIKTPKKHYFLVNKPVGVVTTNYDPSGRTRVIDLAPTQDRVFPVGRLDRSSEGLIIVTNDGEFANLLTHPRYGVPKTYLVRVAGAPTSEDLFKLRKGIYLSDGFCRIESVKIKSRHGQSTDLIMILNEGKNREIRRVLAKLGHKVVRLKRLSVGTLKLGEVPTGAWRVLTPSEIEKLRQLALADAPRAKSADESGSAPARERGEFAESTGPALTTEITDATEISDSLTASDLSSLGSDELDNELAGLLSAEDEDFSGADFTEVDESELEEEFGTMDEWPEDDAEEAPSPKKAREKKPKKQRPARAAFSEDASDEDQEAMAEMEDEESSLELGEDFELSSDAEELAQDFGMDDGDDDLDDDLEGILGDDFQVTRGKAPGANAGNVLDYEGEEGEASSEDASSKPRRAPRPDFDGPRPERGPRPDRGGPRGRFRDDRGSRDRGPRDYDRGPRDRGDSRGPRSFGDRPRFGGRDRGGRDDRGPRGGGFRPRGNDQGRGYGPPGQDRFPRRQAREFGPEDGFGMNRQEGAEEQQGPGEGQSEQSFDRPRRPYRSGPGGGPGRGGPRGGDRGFAPRGDRPRFGDRGRDDRGGGGGRGFAPRGDRPRFGDRGRDDRGGPRGEGGRGYGGGDRGDRGDRGFAPRGDRPRFGDRGRDDRGGPRGEGGDRGFAPRGDRPRFGDRGRDDRGGGGGRGFAPRGDRPRFGDRGRDDRGGPRGESGRGFGGGGGGRGGFDRPRREEFGDGGSRGRTGGGGFRPRGDRFEGGRGRPGGPRGGFGKGRGRNDGDR